ncbi:lysozyme inhibitor LprI family protein [Alkalimonas sp.]|uniref:lysozyme inhibitor LprI family protein n=1 Tax=Alkalimonas sp. TaxID=1872453 RepID=UPI00263AC91F|nr:lysozyme inhibitor LprI family protein [Alkalimonas sp.]MCC5825164.1 DUF1311 domain-containing protein [Alkalimonas sp.]
MKKRLVLCLACCSLAAFSCEEHRIDCNKAYSTYDINQCAAMELDKARQQLTDYLETVLEHRRDDAELVAAIQAAQQDWERYASAHCQAVYTQWRDGTIRTAMALSCMTELTQQRTHELWQRFLTFMDSTPAVLPEPGLLELP